MLQTHSLHAGGWMVEKTGIGNEVAILDSRKKPELVMRSPSWIRAVRSGPGDTLLSTINPAQT